MNVQNKLSYYFMEHRSFKEKISVFEIYEFIKKRYQLHKKIKKIFRKTQTTQLNKIKSALFQKAIDETFPNAKDKRMTSLTDFYGHQFLSIASSFSPSKQKEFIYCEKQLFSHKLEAIRKSFFPPLHKDIPEDIVKRERARHLNAWNKWLTNEFEHMKHTLGNGIVDTDLMTLHDFKMSVLTGQNSHYVLSKFADCDLGNDSQTYEACKLFEKQRNLSNTVNKTSNFEYFNIRTSTVGKFIAAFPWKICAKKIEEKDPNYYLHEGKIYAKLSLCGQRLLVHYFEKYITERMKFHRMVFSALEQTNFLCYKLLQCAYELDSFKHANNYKQLIEILLANKDGTVNDSMSTNDTSLNTSAHDEFITAEILTKEAWKFLAPCMSAVWHSIINLGPFPFVARGNFSIVLRAMGISSEQALTLFEHYLTMRPDITPERWRTEYKPNLAGLFSGMLYKVPSCKKLASHDELSCCVFANYTDDNLRKFIVAAFMDHNLPLDEKLIERIIDIKNKNITTTTNTDNQYQLACGTYLEGIYNPSSNEVPDIDEIKKRHSKLNPLYFYQTSKQYVSTEA